MPASHGNITRPHWPCQTVDQIKLDDYIIIVLDEKSIASEFNSHFVSIGLDLAIAMHKSESVLLEPLPCSFHLLAITADGVEKFTLVLIDTMADTDVIKSTQLKSFSCIISHPLVKIIMDTFSITYKS